MRISVIGDWHNAHVTARCLAALGHDVTLVNPPGRPAWTSFPALPIEEPGLLQLPEPKWKNWPPVPGTVDWVAMDVAGNLDEVAVVCRSAPDPLLLSSQVPLGFCESLKAHVAYIPENMRIGDAVRGFLHPDRLVIGSSDDVTRDDALDILDAIVAPRILCDLATAEMIKHATNGFLAMSVSFANDLARVGQPFGVDMAKVTEALRADKRIGRHAYVRAGLGFGDGTLARDVVTLSARGSKMASATLQVNGYVDQPEPTTHDRYLRGERCV
jgi:UDPglucose 6-dehydrogenase